MNRLGCHICDSDYAPEAEERECAMRIITQLALVGGSMDVRVISRELRKIVHHEFFAYALVRVFDGAILQMVNLDFPVCYLDALSLRAGSGECDLLKKWLSTRKPVVTLDAPFFGNACGEPAHTSSVALHAQLDPTGARGLIFFFGAVPRSLLARCKETLQFMTPYLYASTARTFWTPLYAHAARALTGREIEVIEWMYYGKTNEEIAVLLNISVYTVKNHVQNILLKLSAANRTQAVLRAADAGLIRYEDRSAGP